MRWQKRARLGVAIFGIVCAVVVYAAIGERQDAAPPPPIERVDPKAQIESVGAQVQQERGTERDFDIKSERQLFYENGSSRLFGVEIRVRGRQGRDFALTAKEARAGEDRRVLELSGEVKLQASDGFELKAAQASFNQDDGIVRAPGEVTFAKGAMRGGGVGMTYDQMKDVLGLAERARVNMTDDEGTTTLDFSSGSAVVNRLEDLLTLDGEVHVLRGEQAFVADRAVARMTPDESAVTFIELRGSASVSGGSGGLDSMSARDIDLDYTDDGATLERVVLNGDAAVALTATEASSGRQITGDTLDLTLAPDGSVTRALGRTNVRLVLPGGDGTTARAVSAQQLDAAGEPGRGLTTARFTDNVEYREEAPRGGSARIARSRALRIALDGDAIDAAVFTGAASFQEDELQASAGEARYEPRQGMLRLGGVENGARPRVADQRITIDAPTIDITLEGRGMKAAGGVRTTIRSQANSRLPGLLNGDAPANVEGRTLEYSGASGRALYTTDAALWQGQTAIRGDAISIDQQSGDLVVVGSARSDIALETGRSAGQAVEIRYDDETRVISYLSNRPVPVRGRATTIARGSPPPPPGGRAGAAPPLAPQAQLIGPQGQLRADRLEVVLSEAGRRAERIEAYVGVTARVDTRTATSDRLTYFAEDERYVLVSDGIDPVKVVEACRETSGRTLTFFRSADRIIVDGNEQIRTQTKTGGPCTAPTAPPAR